MLHIARALNDEGIASPTGKLLVQERHPLHPQKRGLHRDVDSGGANAKDKADPIPDREGVSRHHLQSQVPAGQQADALPRTEDRPPPQSRKHLPAQRTGQVATGATGRSADRTPRAASSPTTSATPSSSAAAGLARPPGSTPSPSRSSSSMSFGPTYSPMATSAPW